jgi:sulfatase modifying factor 1
MLTSQESWIMKLLAHTVVVLALAVGLGVDSAPERAFAQAPEQQAAPKEQPAADQPAAAQPQVSPEQQAAAEKLGLPVVITNSIGMKLVLIPAGEFIMGSKESPEELARLYAKWDAKPEYFAGEQPQHQVRITKPFYLGMHEVTVEQFRQFSEAKNYRKEAERDQQYSWRNPYFSQSDDHPVVNVSWSDSVAFCAWMSGQERKRYSLPTEAQWEYACRAGTTTQFSHGDDPEKLTRVGNVADAALKAKHTAATWTVLSCDGYAFTSPVGRFQVNAFGVYDMHGNVWEWCADRYGENYYKNSPLDDPTGPATGSIRVNRGSSWLDHPLSCRSAFRYGSAPDHRDYFLGFRVALDVAAKGEPPKEDK